MIIWIAVALVVGYFCGVIVQQIKLLRLLPLMLDIVDDLLELADIKPGDLPLEDALMYKEIKKLSSMISRKDKKNGE